MNLAREKSDGWDKMSIEKILSVKKQIGKDFLNMNAKKIENFFEDFLKDRRNKSFIDYYNRTVLDKEKIYFGEFRYQWGLHLTRQFYTFFDENFGKLKKEITKEKNIGKFFQKYCSFPRREAIFCSKIFHTVLPKEFPPVDNAIKNNFGLNVGLIDAVSIIKEGYKSFIKENPKLIRNVRKVLTQSKFDYLRAKELSDIRILDMYYWFSENHKQ